MTYQVITNDESAHKNNYAQIHVNQHARFSLNAGSTCYGYADEIDEAVPKMTLDRYKILHEQMCHATKILKPYMW